MRVSITREHSVEKADNEVDGAEETRNGVQKTGSRARDGAKQHKELRVSVDKRCYLPETRVAGCAENT